MHLKLDIVCFDVPYPPDYGGAIDVYYRIKALYEAGVEVHLHCFEKSDRPASEELQQICAKTYYYPRQQGFLYTLTRRPYVVATRANRQLLERLGSADGPILFEGLHTCAFASARNLAHRNKYIRMHNVEWEYYRSLADTANSGLKRLHFTRESAKLRRFEREALGHMAAVFAISGTDREYFEARHPRVQILPAFHQYDHVNVLTGEGDYVLFQGDLTIDDNLNIIRRLSRQVADLGIPVKIAGRTNGNPEVEEALRHDNIAIYSDVSSNEMLDLMQGAQIHVIDSNITSGFKLKLIAALHTARHIIARRVLVSKDLRNVVNTYSDRSELGTLIRPLMQRPVSRKDIEIRRGIVEPLFSNTHNAQTIIETIENDEENK